MTSVPPLQILSPQDFEEFPPPKPLDSLQLQDSALLGSASPHLELDLGLGGGASASASGLGVEVGGAGGSSGGAAAAVVGSSLGAELDFRSEASAAGGVRPLPLDPESQRRLSLQEPQTHLDSRTPQRHGSDPGGS